MVLATEVIGCSLLTDGGCFVAPRDLRKATVLGSTTHDEQGVTLTGRNTTGPPRAAPS